MNERTRHDIRNNLQNKLKEKYNIIQLKELGGYHNFIYEGTVNNKNYIFRITKNSHRDKVQLNEEIEFINILIQNNIPVNKPMKLNSSQYVEEIKVDKNIYFICVFEKIEGLNWNEKTLSDENIFNAGKTLGMIHRVSQNTEKVFKRRDWESNRYLEEFNDIVTDTRVKDKLREHINKLNTLPKSKNVYGLIHGDYLYGNMIYDEDNITAIDFDECEYSWFIYDIAVYLFYYLLGGDPANIDIEPNKKLFKIFMRGYREENKIDVIWIEMLNDFLRLREYKLLCSIYKSSNLNSLGKWQRSYIETSEHRIKNDIPFVDIEFKKLYEEI